MSEKLALREKIGFGMGDAGLNVVYQAAALILAFYYTDVAMIPATTVAFIFLIVRVSDVITDPLMGFVADKTQTKWGKYRPYLIWFCIPFSLLLILSFSVPNISVTGKAIYASITYALLMLVFTIICIPYCALGTVISGDPKERSSANGIRFALNGCTTILIAATLMPMANYFENLYPGRGYQLSAAIMAIVALGMFLHCFFSTEERIKVKQEKNSNVISDLKILARNKVTAHILLARFISPLLQLSKTVAKNSEDGVLPIKYEQLRNKEFVIFLTGFLISYSTLAARGTMTLYYIMNYANNAAHLASMFLTASMAGGAIGSLMAGHLSKNHCVLALNKYVVMIMAAVSLISFFVPTTSIAMMFVLAFAFGLLNLMTAPLIHCLMGGIIDFGELKFGRRMDGITYSIQFFMLKLSLAIGGSFSLWFMGYVGYDASLTAQPDQVINSIQFMFTLPAFAGFSVFAYCLHKMTLTSKSMLATKALLEKRRQSPDDTNVDDCSFDIETVQFS